MDRTSEESARAMARAAEAASVREMGGAAFAELGLEADEPRPAHATCLSVNHVNLFYGDHQALRDVSLDIPEREITSFIGPSGCGKSTFLRSLNLMNREIRGCRVEGEIIYDGRNINTRGENLYELRRSIGMVFQQPNPFHKSIYENIVFAPKRHGLKGKENLDALVEESLRGAALWDEVKDRLKRSALGLSGGQQQRLCIARALAVEPEILLMDEPTSALDPISTLKIEDLMGELKKNYTVVIVTHNMQQATRIADYTAFFLVGEVVEYAPTTDLFSHPREKKTEDYITGRFG